MVTDRQGKMWLYRTDLAVLGRVMDATLREIGDTTPGEGPFSYS
jgi:hypothetical protein